MNPDITAPQIATATQVVTRALEQQIRESERVLQINKNDRDEAQKTFDRLNSVVSMRERNLFELKLALDDVREGFLDL